MFKQLRSIIYQPNFLGAISRKVLGSAFSSSPSFIVAGAQKAGTSAVYRYFSRHPQVRAPQLKEVRFFSHDHRFNRGEAFYHSHFPKLKRDEITFDATPAYMYLPWTIERIKAYNPNIKIIILMREPVSRAFSQWNMYSQMLAPGSNFNFPYASEKSRQGLMSIRNEDGVLPFSEVVRIEREGPQSVEDAPEPSLLRRGLYAQQLRPMIDAFSKNQIHIVESEELKTKTRETLNELSDFLEIEPFEVSDEKLAPVHVRSYDSKIDAETQSQLKDYFAKPNQDLFELIGREFDWS